MLSVLNHTCNHCCLLFRVFGGLAHSDCARTRTAVFPGGANKVPRLHRQPLQTRAHASGNRHKIPNQWRNGHRTQCFCLSFSACGERISSTRLLHLGRVLFLRCFSLKEPKGSRGFFGCCRLVRGSLPPADIGCRVKVMDGRCSWTAWTPGCPEWPACFSSLQPLLRPALSHGHRGHTGFPVVSGGSQAAPTARASICPVCAALFPGPWPLFTSSRLPHCPAGLSDSFRSLCHTVPGQSVPLSVMTNCVAMSLSRGGLAA